MSCENEQRVIASLLDGREEFDGEGGALGHVEKCGTCYGQYRSLLSLRNALRALNSPAMPDGLTERLRVLASHERERFLSRVDFAARFRHWGERLKLSFDNMMRPLALPFAGGLLTALSTLVIFACVMQTTAFPNNVRSDVPLPMIANDPDGEELYWAGQAPQLLPVTEYVKSDATSDNVIIVAVNLDPHHVQNGWLTLSLADLGIAPASAFQVHDLLTGERFLWQGARNFVQLDPAFVPAAIFRLRRRVRTERDFDYFL